MFYNNLRYFNWFSSFFGLHLPFLSESDKVSPAWLRLWSFILSVLFIVSYFYPNNFLSAVEGNMELEQISRANNIIVNVIIILLNLCNGDRINRETYATVNSILCDLQIHNQNQKLLAIKLQVWVTVPFFVFLIAIVMEFTYLSPPYILIVKMPIFLSLTHLILHLSLLLAILKVVNLRMNEKSFISRNNFFMEEFTEQTGLLHYFIYPTITMYHVQVNSNSKAQYNLYFLYKIYEDLGICLTLLEKSHGIQMLLSIWLMFSNAVTGITVITKEQVNMQWVVVIRSALPFFWYFIGCYVNNQLRQEVERTELLIVKRLIDFRSDRSTREALQIFMQVVAANRLEFTACNLFRLNYATVLGTVVNVITYSIILIQVL